MAKAKSASAASKEDGGGKIPEAEVKEEESEKALLKEIKEGKGDDGKE